jgi:hypothetical protein
MSLGLAVLLLALPGFHQASAVTTIPLVVSEVEPQAIQAVMVQPSPNGELVPAPHSFPHVKLMQPSAAQAAETNQAAANSLSIKNNTLAFGTSEGRPSENLMDSGSNMSGTADSVGAPLKGMYVAVAAEPMPPFKAGPAEVRRSNRSWLALTIAQHTAATFDAWSTRRAISRGGSYEADPLMRPFAHSSALYGVMQIGPGALDYLARRMRRSDHKWVRRLWWVPQSAATVGFVYSGAHNLAVSR